MEPNDLDLAYIVFASVAITMAIFTTAMIAIYSLLG